MLYKIIRSYYNKNPYLKNIKFSNLSVNMLVIDFKNNGNILHFIVDTGSLYSVINEGILPFIIHKPIDKTSTGFGIEGNVVDVSFTDIELENKGIIYKDSFEIMDLTTAFKNIKEEYGFDVAGLIGSEFLDKYDCIIDYKSGITVNIKK